MARWVKLGAFVVLGLSLVSMTWAAAYGAMRPPFTSIALQRGLEGEVVQRRWRSLSEISPHLVRAVIAAEDSRFCAHNGFDFDAIRTAMAEARSGGRRRGASTISQQTAKNAFLWNGGGYVRKGMEAWFTTLTETFWSKRRVMEVYLNIAEWGDGAFGAEAAAQLRFGKSAADLTAREAAALAAVLPNPNGWRLDPPSSFVRQRTETIRARMAVVRRDGLAACVLATAPA